MIINSPHISTPRSYMTKVGNIAFLFAYAWKKGKALFLIVSAQNVFSALLPLTNVIGLGMVVNSLMAHEPYGGMVKLIAIYISINLGVSIINSIFSYLQNQAIRRVSNVMQFDYARDSLNLNYHYVQDGGIFDLKQKSMGVSPALSLPLFGKILNNMIQLAGITYIFSVLSPIFIAVLALYCLVSIILTFKMRETDYELKNGRVESDRKSDYLYKVMTDYRYAKEVRLNIAGGYVGKKYLGVLGSYFEKLKAYHRKATSIGLLNAIATVAQTAAMYLYFSYQVSSGQLTIAEYTVLLSATALLASIIIGFLDNVAQLRNICKDVALYRQYVELVSTKSDIAASNQFPEKDIDFSNAVIRFENVSFAYRGAGKTVLNNISIGIEKGDRIGIVGLNGSGKTTLVKLLTRIYDPTEGRITINDIDIKEIPFRQYSAHIGIVLQDFLLFAYSIKENIVFDKSPDEVKLAESIEKSGLGNKIGTLANKTDTIIYRQLDDDGIELSGGEGQKLAMARAIYKDAEILILDEPTSALDPIAEYELFSRLNDIAKGKTVLFISHRLSSTRFCDKIIVLENGKIAELGNHGELMAKGGTYANLYEAQARYYRTKEGICR